MYGILVGQRILKTQQVVEAVVVALVVCSIESEPNFSGFLYRYISKRCVSSSLDQYESFFLKKMIESFSCTKN